MPVLRWKVWVPEWEGGLGHGGRGCRAGGGGVGGDDRPQPSKQKATTVNTKKPLWPLQGADQHCSRPPLPPPGHPLPTDMPPARDGLPRSQALPPASPCPSATPITPTLVSSPRAAHGCVLAVAPPPKGAVAAALGGSAEVGGGGRREWQVEVGAAAKRRDEAGGVDGGGGPRCRTGVAAAKAPPVVCVARMAAGLSGDTHHSPFPPQQGRRLPPFPLHPPWPPSRPSPPSDPPPSRPSCARHSHRRFQSWRQWETRRTSEVAPSPSNGSKIYCCAMGARGQCALAMRDRRVRPCGSTGRVRAGPPSVPSDRPPHPRPCGGSGGVCPSRAPSRPQRRHVGGEGGKATLRPGSNSTREGVRWKPAVVVHLAPPFASPKSFQVRNRFSSRRLALGGSNGWRPAQSRLRATTRCRGDHSQPYPKGNRRHQRSQRAKIETAGGGSRRGRL